MRKTKMNVYKCQGCGAEIIKPASTSTGVSVRHVCKFGVVGVAYYQRSEVSETVTENQEVEKTA